MYATIMVLEPIPMQTVGNNSNSASSQGTPLVQQTILDFNSRSSHHPWNSNFEIGWWPRYIDYDDSKRFGMHAYRNHDASPTGIEDYDVDIGLCDDTNFITEADANFDVSNHYDQHL